MIRGLGYKPDKLDERDRLYGVKRAAAPRMVEQRFDDLVVHVRDQGGTNSCVGQSMRSGVEVRRALDGEQHIDLSALGLYWPARAVDGFHREDGGALIRSAAYVAHKFGIPTERSWPFREGSVNTRPAMSAELDGMTRADGSYERVRGHGGAQAEAVLDALQARCPVVFGTMITEAVTTHVGNGTVPAPSALEPRLGGHAMVALGFDRGGERVRVLNSWGADYADHGFVWLATDWFADALTMDIWALLPKQETAHA